jgi:uncharacterized phage protein (predicted DNA packaging)
MIALVTLERVKSALRIDTDMDDALLTAYIHAASAAVVAYLKGQADALLDLDTGGDMPSGTEVPPAIEIATIILVGHFYREPDGDTDRAFEQGYLPRPVTALLYPLRDPALA